MKVIRKSLLTGAHEVEGLPVVIDVLRAFTTSAVLFSLGLDRLILVGSPEEAFALRQERGWLIGGEQGGNKIDGFDFGNSPTELLQTDRSRLAGQTLALRTSSGTQGVVAAIQRSPRVILGSLVMAQAIGRYLHSLPDVDTITLVAMGSLGKKVSVEDEVCAEYLEHLLVGTPFDPLDAMWRCASDIYMLGALRGQLHEVPMQDVILCLQRDLFNFVLLAELKDGLIQVRRIPV